MLSLIVPRRVNKSNTVSLSRKSRDFETFRFSERAAENVISKNVYIKRVFTDVR